MRTTGNIFKISALAAALAFTYPGDVLATGESTTTEETEQTSSQSADIQQETVSAQELMESDVRNLANPIGDVRDLVLNSDSTAVQYVLYEVPYPYTLFNNADNGFVAYDNVAVEPGAGYENVLRIDDEASQKAPEELTLERDQVDHRLVSRLLDDTVEFADGTTRRIEDILIDRQTGEIKGYVVNRNPDAWFNDEPAVVPPDEVKVGEQGDITTTAEFAALESLN